MATRRPPRTLSIWCQREGVPSSKRRVKVALPPNAPSWRGFMLALCDAMEMEAIEGLYNLSLGRINRDFAALDQFLVLAQGRSRHGIRLIGSAFALGEVIAHAVFEQAA